MGPTGPRWAPCCPHELCYLGVFGSFFKIFISSLLSSMCITDHNVKDSDSDFPAVTSYEYYVVQHGCGYCDCVAVCCICEIQDIGHWITSLQISSWWWPCRRWLHINLSPGKPRSSQRRRNFHHDNPCVTLTSYMRSVVPEVGIKDRDK